MITPLYFERFFHCRFADTVPGERPGKQLMQVLFIFSNVELSLEKALARWSLNQFNHSSCNFYSYGLLPSTNKPLREGEKRWFNYSMTRRFMVSIVYSHNEDLRLNSNVLEKGTLTFRALLGPQSCAKGPTKHILWNTFRETVFKEINMNGGFYLNLFFCSFQ